MNRDIKDILYIDFDEEKAAFHKDNVLVLPRWQGDLSDRELYDILPFLESKFKPLNFRSKLKSWCRCEKRTLAIWESWNK